MSSPSLYADLSHYYDLLCSNIDYHEQCDFVLRANSLWGNGGKQYLDLACGSGMLLAHFSDAGFSCNGLDISQDMLDMAADRCPSANLICLDMSEIDLHNSMDLISCFLYSIHYCSSVAALQKTFKNIYAALSPGGVFCFDAVDKDCIANDDGHYHYLTLPNHNQLRFQTRWHYSGEGDDLDLHIDIRETAGESQRHYQEKHSMTAVNIINIRQMLENEGFEVQILEHDFARLREWQGENGNVVFCAVKAA